MRTNTRGQEEGCRPVEGLEPRRLFSVGLVKDVNPLTAGGAPGELVDLNGVVYFAADAGGGSAGVGRELYRSDGTAGGTRLVADLFAGARSSNPNDLTRLGSNFLFVADGGNGAALWRSDGTAAGTVAIKSLPSYASALDLPLTVSGGYAYFRMDAAPAGPCIWRTDGTAEGTIPLVSRANAAYLTDVNGTLYFENDAGAGGRELWKSDGTVAGTVLVKDIIAGTSGSSPAQLTNVNGVLYFTAKYSAASPFRYLYRTDGTAAGTTLINIPGRTDEPTALTSFGGTLFFSFSPEGGLWKLAGNTPTQVSALTVGAYSTGSMILTPVGAKLMFVAGGVLWRSDGTTAGTVRVDPGDATVPHDAINLVNVNGTLFFSADDGVHGWELWRSDGTAAGTAMVEDTYPGAASGVYSHGLDGLLPRSYVVSGGRLYYAGNDGVSGSELFRSDGTGAGTGVVRDLNTAPVSSNPVALARVGERLFFQADDGINGVGMWVSDGTSAGTSRAAKLSVNVNPPTSAGIAEVGGFAVFLNDADHKFYATDGTPGGTFAFARDPSKPFDTFIASAPNSAVGLDGVALVRGYSAAYGYTLWRADPATRYLSPLTPPASVSAPEDSTLPVVLGHRAVFRYAGPEGAELWVSDGTAAGTTVLKDIRAGATGSFPAFRGVAGGRLYFLADDGTSNHLWATDGTAAGTVLVDASLPGPNGSTAGPAEFTLAGGTTFFTAFDSAHGQELWKVTPGGVALVSDVVPGVTGSNPSGLSAVGDLLTFWATDASGGRELWRSDGTTAGTVRVGDLNPGAAGSVTGTPPHAVSGGLLFFAATDGQGGAELYQSDGTPGGTVRVGDLYPGATGADPQGLTDVGGRLFFAASDPAYGRELWAYRDTAAPVAGPAAYDPSARVVRVSFSENVSGSIADGDFTLVDRTTGQTVPASALARAYDLTTNTLTLTFSGAPADGDYRLVVTGGGVTDPSGNAMGRDVTLDFFVLAGDANRDRVVNFADLLAVAKNYTKAGATWAEGDFTGDGVVNFADLLVLAKAYNKALAAPAPLPSAEAAVAAPVSAAASVLGEEAKGAPVFSTTRVAKPVAPVAPVAPRKPVAVKGKAKGR